MDDDAPLTADEILTFGPVVEAVAWHPIWVQEARAPIAVAAGRAKLGPVFNSEGVGRAVLIRPCVSRGKRIRGLPPIYTPGMLESNAGVFDGWPMFMDHVDPAVAQTLAKRGRSVRELGGQVLTGRWHRDYVHEDDQTYGYQRGATIADTWATPFVREMVGENPNLLHTSINAWPTSGKPSPVPWRPAIKGMMIEGIRRQPQGSVDYVVRGGAGGRLLVQEGLEDEGAWPQAGEWSEEDRRFVVSLAESFYASPRMADPLTLPSKPDELQAWLEEHAPHLVPALAELDTEDEPLIRALVKKGKTRAQATKIVAGSKEEMSEADVRKLIAESLNGQPTVEEFEQHLEERAQELIAEREASRTLSARAFELIESAEGIPPTWKADLKARYSVLPSGPSPALLVESEKDSDGKELSELQVLEARVKADLQRSRDLILEAQGKPRVKGEGGGSPSNGDGGRRERSRSPYWRQAMAEMGIAESEAKALEIFGPKVED